MLSASVPQVPCPPDNGGCQQECAVEENEVSCTCFNNYEPVSGGNGSICNSKSVNYFNEFHSVLPVQILLDVVIAVRSFTGSSRVVIPGNVDTSSNYTVCALIFEFSLFAGDRLSIFEIQDTSKLPLT